MQQNHENEMNLIIQEIMKISLNLCYWSNI